MAHGRVIYRERRAQADLKVFRAFDIHGLTVVSAITAQNTVGVEAVLPVEKEFFEKQIHTLFSDIRPDAIKSGMLYSEWAVNLIAEVIKEYSLRNFVIDPVTVSSSGKTLVADGTLGSIREKLFPLAKVITPNIYEASVLTGLRIEERKGMEKTAKVLKDMGSEVVVITGGHLEAIALDLYYDGEFHDVESEKAEGEYHGTGCVFSAAIAAAGWLHTPRPVAAAASPFSSLQAKVSKDSRPRPMTRSLPSANSA